MPCGKKAYEDLEDNPEKVGKKLKKKIVGNVPERVAKNLREKDLKI